MSKKLKIQVRLLMMNRLFFNLRSRINFAHEQLKLCERTEGP